MATITLLPNAAVDRICHDEQMVIWSGDVVGALGLGEFLRDDLSYEDIADLHEVVKRELRSVIKMALSHPEARTVYSLPKTLTPSPLPQQP
ncbi:hypothetical protein [Chelatococcus sp.]|uniref:hypothetical protein n=1 Tax=Chelatococcus sp. TaxID=1953771 RepID=UPI001EC61C00|nr:hypothetical protein [Chelatococcus sp.]MBX3547461.1 hypothetical protein [Chelatococcus sp.]